MEKMGGVRPLVGRNGARMSFGGWLLATGLPAAVLIPLLVAPFSVWVVMALTAHLGPGGGLPQLFMMFGYLSLALPGALLIVFGG